MKKANDNDLRKLMRKECKKTGGQKFWAIEKGLCISHVCEVLLGRREVTEKMANALGYVYTQERWCKKPSYD